MHLRQQAIATVIFIFVSLLFRDSSISFTNERKSSNNFHAPTPLGNQLALIKVIEFLVFTHVMRRPCWCTKQWQNVAQVLHNNRIKFPSAIVLYTNRVAVTSRENQELSQLRVVCIFFFFYTCRLYGNPPGKLAPPVRPGMTVNLLW